MQMQAPRTQNEEEQVPQYEALNNASSQRGVTDNHIQTNKGDNECQKKVLVFLCVMCVVFAAAIVILSVTVYSLKIAFEMNIENQNRNCQESTTEMNANLTSLNLQQTLANGKSDGRVNTNSTAKKILDQPKQDDEKESRKNKVSLTACAHEKIYNEGHPVLFPHIYTSYGISSQVISSLKGTGIFTCERPGLYLISIFLSTDNEMRRVDLYKNSTGIAFLYFPSLYTDDRDRRYGQTHSATILENLSIGDVLTVKPAGTMKIYAKRQSCMSILKLSN